MNKVNKSFRTELHDPIHGKTRGHLFRPKSEFLFYQLCSTDNFLIRPQPRGVALGSIILAFQAREINRSEFVKIRSEKMSLEAYFSKPIKIFASPVTLFIAFLRRLGYTFR
jgi:hypothetical protein